MGESTVSKTYTIEKALEIPELREMAMKMQKEEVEGRPKPFRTKKFRKALEIATLGVLQEIRSEHPGWPLKDVLAEIIKDFNPEIPSDLILEMTQLIVSEWEKTQQEAVVTS